MPVAAFALLIGTVAGSMLRAPGWIAVALSILAIGVASGATSSAAPASVLLSLGSALAGYNLGLILVVIFGAAINSRTSTPSPSR